MFLYSVFFMLSVFSAGPTPLLHNFLLNIVMIVRGVTSLTFNLHETSNSDNSISTNGFL